MADAGGTAHKRRLDRVMDPGFLDGLSEIPTAEVRTLRADAAAEEADLSYERRMLHGRIAIIQGELARRAGTGGEGSLIDRLTAILADDRTPTRGAFPGSEPKFDYDAPTRKVSKLLSDDTLMRLPDLPEDDVRARLAIIEEAEVEISTTRRAVQVVLDALTAELASRYRSGEADPGDALTG